MKLDWSIWRLYIYVCEESLTTGEKIPHCVRKFISGGGKLESSVSFCVVQIFKGVTLIEIIENFTPGNHRQEKKTVKYFQKT